MQMRFAAMLSGAVMAALLSMPVQAADGPLPAFPGAEGYGSTTPGGRGGKVIVVTNLNDNGPGSLREAVSANEPRIVIFGVSGTITLDRDLIIRNPFITIAGQTAPGDGICLRKFCLIVDTNDVVVRQIRIRRGAESRRQEDGVDLIQNANNVILDHCSISWTCDEAINTWHGAKNSTFQWCIISEALHDAVHAGHGFAATLGGTNTSYHHNLLANCPGRNPSIGGNEDFRTTNLDFRNNVIFNYQERVIDGKPTSINFVNNYYKPGPSSRFSDHVASIDSPNYQNVGTPRWYISGNVMEGRPDILADNRKGTIGHTEFMVDKPIDTQPIKAQTADEIYPLVLADVGATLPHRDSVDLRVLEETKTGKTHHNDGIVKDPSDVGGWPELKSIDPPTDSDHDGIPDWWETKYGLNANDASDANKDMNGDGYTNIEKYLNGIDPKKKVDWRDPKNNNNTLLPGSLDDPAHPPAPTTKPAG